MHEWVRDESGKEPQKRSLEIRIEVLQCHVGVVDGVLGHAKAHAHGHADEDVVRPVAGPDDAGADEDDAEEFKDFLVKRGDSSDDQPVWGRTDEEVVHVLVELAGDSGDRNTPHHPVRNAGVLAQNQQREA